MGPTPFFVKVAEQELGDICDHVMDDGSVDPAFVGRYEKFDKKWVNVVPKGSTAEGAIGQKGLDHEWLGIRIRELGNLMKAVADGKPFTEARQAQWKGIQRKMRALGTRGDFDSHPRVRISAVASLEVWMHFRLAVLFDWAQLHASLLLLFFVLLLLVLPLLRFALGSLIACEKGLVLSTDTVNMRRCRQ